MIFTCGDSRLHAVDLFMPDGSTFIIDSSADTVQIAIVSKDLTIRYTDPLELVSTTPGADWAKSKVAFKFPKVATSGIEFTARQKEIKAVLEVQVTFDADGLADDWTWRVGDVTLVPGNIA